VELVDEAVAAGEQARDLIEATGDDAALGEWECWLSNACRAVGRMPDAWAAAKRAIDRMEPLGDSPALARALAAVARHKLVAGRFAESLENGRRGFRFEMAERFGAEQTAISALNSYGTSLSSGTTDVEGATTALHEALDRAKRAGLPEEVTRAATNLAFVLVRMAQPAAALSVVEEGIAAAQAHELHHLLSNLRPARAELLLMLGDWVEATAELTAVLRDPTVSDINRCLVLAQLGRIPARRGHPGAVDAIEEALAIALRHGEAQLIVPARVALAEAAWLAGDLPRATAEVEASVPLAHLLDPGHLRDLARVAQRAAVDWAPADLDDEATRLMMSGDHRALARFWTSADAGTTRPTPSPTPTTWTTSGRRSSS